MRARQLRAPILVSANAFSRWHRTGEYVMYPDRRSGEKKLKEIRDWLSFRIPKASHFVGNCVCLDSAGFVAMSEYRGYPWTPDAYLDLAAAAPWHWFASMDLCVEPEIAQNNDAVLDRISGTVRLNIQCLNGAEERGIADRFMPVIQGWEVEHYLRCLDRMRWMIQGRPLIGVGSMCRRHVEGQRGILQIIDALDRHLPPLTRLHLFGLKSQGMEELRGHPRIASFDSQAYGTAARQAALRGLVKSKTNAYLADVMAVWYDKQKSRLSKEGFSFRAPTGLLGLSPPQSNIDRVLEQSSEHLRLLLEDGEIDFINPQWAYESAFQEVD